MDVMRQTDDHILVPFDFVWSVDTPRRVSVQRGVCRMRPRPTFHQSGTGQDIWEGGSRPVGLEKRQRENRDQQAADQRKIKVEVT